jgi:hypothetical protein
VGIGKMSVGKGRRSDVKIENRLQKSFLVHPPHYPTLLWAEYYFDRQKKSSAYLELGRSIK